MQAAELGLSISKTTGHAYLNAYKDECTLLIGYKGLIDLAKRSDTIKSIEAHVVKEMDEFQVDLGSKKNIHHLPLYAKENQKVIAVYAIAVLSNGESQFEVMTMEDVMHVKKSAKTDKIWNEHFNEMAKKTAIRRLLKYVGGIQEVDLANEYDSDLRQSQASKITEKLNITG